MRCSGTFSILLPADASPEIVGCSSIMARVLEARHGRDALELWQAHRDELTAVITDMRMPELGGRELVERLRRDRPELCALYLSGYAEGLSNTVLGPRDRFVVKSFTSDSLLGALNDLHARS